MKTGFTLIELLVVILIIGILAAVALPQYQRAVDKSRFMKYIQVAHGIKRAQETYFLANGLYSPDLQALDVDYSGGCRSIHALNNEWSCPEGYFIDLGAAYNQSLGALSVSLCPGYNTGSAACSPHREATYSLYFDHYSGDPSKKGTASCSGYTDRGKAICKSLHL